MVSEHIGGTQQPARLFIPCTSHAPHLHIWRAGLEGYWTAASAAQQHEVHIVMCHIPRAMVSRSGSRISGRSPVTVTWPSGDFTWHTCTAARQDPDGLELSIEALTLQKIARKNCPTANVLIESPLWCSLLWRQQWLQKEACTSL